MPEAINIGPFLLPTWPITIIAALWLAIGLSGWLARRGGVDGRRVERIAEGAALMGLVGARLGYVLLNWEAYQDAPWTAFFLWQPGYLPGAGLAFGVAYVAWQVWRTPASRRLGELRALGSGYALAGVAFAVAFALLSLSAAPGIPRRGDVSPDFTLHTLQGSDASLSGLKGRAVVLNFWATWCPPCRREMPLLDAVQAKYASRGAAVVGVNVGEPAERVERFVRSVGVSYPIWVDAPPAHPGVDSTRAVYRRFGGVGLPTTVFIGPDGVVVDRHVGELSRALLQNRIETMLRDSPKAEGALETSGSPS
ncbi:MAG: redoxin domain-containing protein [Gammaproteobacteria bacterium]|nr:redoxin domain-containing protein [Gammaproteobacteria bacterium]NIR84341.1 redoxin domain-containing protein [Gammaproteobacteria bacterium]NIR89857.1 redoxin domain-containing protein [Gammaproteobacteria bacterium]NIU05724.1 redoxin domain-containing protein [Gammaproteobacteria bacterium]NIV52484.1 redoxin domain-containing protein [Gammaproteobacteria bacterium]